MTEVNRRELYKKFQEKFPIDSLKNMTLDEYTNLNRNDSFCYWLEYETYYLGSIAGGSSFKYGIYRYIKRPKNLLVQSDSQYAWYNKFNQSTPQDAFKVVRDAVVSIASYAHNGNFEAIEKIDILGTVVKWKIAFLYSQEVLIPIYNYDMLVKLADKMGMQGKGNDSSISEIQRFLIKKKGNRDLYEFYDELLDLYKEDESNVVAEDEVLYDTEEDIHYWVYAPGENASMWDVCIKEGVMCLDWSVIGDLRNYNSQEEIQNEVKKMYHSDTNCSNSGKALWDFVHNMQVGDVVYVKKGRRRIMGYGIVESEYYFDNKFKEYCNVRKVKWVKNEEHECPIRLPNKTLTEITNSDYLEDMKQLFKEVGSTRYWWLIADPKTWSMKSLRVGECVEYSLYNENNHKRRIFQCFLDAKKGDIVIGYEASPIKKIVALLKVEKESDGKFITFRKIESLGSFIDYSTFHAIPELSNLGRQGSLFSLTEEEYDYLMDLIRTNNPIQKKQYLQYSKQDFLDEVYISEGDYDSLCELLVEKKNVILQGAPGVGKTFAAKRLAYSMMGEKNEDRIEFVQFHQNYSYEDFIMGYKPTEDGGFELKDGVFYNFCQKANGDNEHDYFFIIDEINRGNLSKIFGEVMMLMENDYRGKEAKLAYRDELFSIPENLYIIGMMNTADRSLAMIDYALRRRFSFFEMQPAFESDGFNRYVDGLEDDKNGMFHGVVHAIVDLNKRIASDDSLGKGFCIGHSYFCNQTVLKDSWLRNVVKYDIEPMLREYWFDNEEKADEEIGKLNGIVK